MSSMKLSTLFCIFKKLNLKKNVNVRHYSKTQERTRASVGAVTTRHFSPRPEVTFILESQGWPWRWLQNNKHDLSALA